MKGWRHGSSGRALALASIRPISPNKQKINEPYIQYSKTVYKLQKLSFPENRIKKDSMF
jgi:hypothetical protein